MAYKHDSLSFAKSVPAEDNPPYIGEIVSVLNALPNEISPLAIKSHEYSFPVLRQEVTGRDVSMINEEPVMLTSDDVYRIAQSAIQDEKAGIKNLVYFELGKLKESPFVHGMLSTFPQTICTELKDLDNSITSIISNIPLLQPFRLPRLLTSKNTCFYLQTMFVDEEENIPELKDVIADSIQKIGYREHKTD